MRAFAFLGFALLCLSQKVSGDEKDLLHSLFNEKFNQLKSEKLPEPEVVLSATTTQATYVCDADAVMANGTTLIKNTLDIIYETFDVVYKAVHPNSGSQDCPFGDSIIGKIRCKLWELNEVKDSTKDVYTKVVDYKSNAEGLLSGITGYFHNCPEKK